MRPWGYSVTVSHNGGDVHAILLTASFDLVILDVMLPGRNGLIRRVPSMRPARVLRRRAPCPSADRYTPRSPQPGRNGGA